jgi:predicted anti-sigma-YlaC factor YlaD
MKYSCKHVALKLSESIDRKLSINEKLLIKFHLLMCKSCQQVEKQMKLLSQSVNHIHHTNETLSKDTRERILNNIKTK